jgi:nicotinate-nucleotide adenylyltransferase
MEHQRSGGGHLRPGQETARRTPPRVAPTPTALGRALGGRLPGRGMRIGILGGSFNPAHGGHLDLSRTALARLELDEIWWLVSPQNPLKPKDGMADLDQRVAQARAAVDHPRIRVTALEAVLGTRYSVDTVTALKRLFPDVDFVWLMGADNLIQLSAWKDWERLFREIAIAVFARPGYTRRALAGTPAALFAPCRMAERQAARLAGTPPPAWVFVHGPLNPSSSTALRNKAAKGGRP